MERQPTDAEHDQLLALARMVSVGGTERSSKRAVHMGASGAQSLKVERLREEGATPRMERDSLKRAEEESVDQRISASNRAAGVSKFRRIRGLVFSFVATTSRSCCVSDAMDPPTQRFTPAADLRRDRPDRSPLLLMVLGPHAHQLDSSLTHLWGEPSALCHDSIFSRNGACGNPGAV